MFYRNHDVSAKQVLLFSCLLMNLFFFAPAAAAPIQGIYEIRPALDEGFVLDETHCTQQEAVFDSLQLFRPLGVKQQEFYLSFTTPSSCRISSLLTGRYLTQADITGVSGEEISASASGSVRMMDASWPAQSQEENPAVPQPQEQAGTQTDSPADAQLWFPEEAADGTYRLRSAAGLYLTLTENRACSGAAVALSPLSGSGGSKKQLWTLTGAPVYAEGGADTDVVNPYLEDGRLRDVKVTVRLQDTTDTLTAATLSTWMISPDGHSLELDEERLRAYVSNLAEHYNTVGRARTFVTSYKVPITLTQGNYGWKMDEEATFARLKEAVSRPGRCSLVPEWSQEGGDFYGTNSDIGDSYVEVDLSAQKVWLYKNGVKLVETDCVSGTAGTDRETPGGVYYIFYMQSPAVLNGADYSSPVSFWMPFNGNIGLHDATWRSSFGGEIYRTDGSHGCVNLPYEAAETMYRAVDIGYPVVCYR